VGLLIASVSSGGVGDAVTRKKEKELIKIKIKNLIAHV
jgi:hypothetical protein